jgi:hypothetical protein
MTAPQHQPVELRAECEREQRARSSVDGFPDEMEPWRLILSVSLAWCVAYESHPSTTFVPCFFAEDKLIEHDAECVQWRGNGMGHGRTRGSRS